MQQFRENLLMLMHMIDELPARKIELIIIQYVNGINDDQRGIFIENGLMACVTIYHKNIEVSEQLKIIHRYLSREVDELILYYIGLIILFRNYLQRVNEIVRINEISSFIGEPKKEEMWVMPELKKRSAPYEEEEDHPPSSGRIRKNRHRLPKRRRINRFRIESSPHVIDDDAESDHAPDLSAMPYVTETGDSGKIGRALSKASLQGMEVKLRILKGRHCSKVIYRQHINTDSTIVRMMKKNEDSAAKEDAPFDIQTGHNNHIEKSIYGRFIHEIANTTQVKRIMLRKINVEWHQFLQFEFVRSTRSRKESVIARMRDVATKKEYRRGKIMFKINLIQQLHTFMKFTITFRSVQQMTFKHIMSDNNLVIVIMSTETNKSLLLVSHRSGYCFENCCIAFYRCWAPSAPSTYHAAAKA